MNDNLFAEWNREPATPPPDDTNAVADNLAMMLEMAKNGKLLAIAIAVQLTDGETASYFNVGEGDVARLNTSLDRCKLRLLERVSGDAEGAEG